MAPPLTQGISFLDAMSELWVRKGWHKEQLNEKFRMELIQWLHMLLLLVPITDSSAVPLLKKILNPKRGVLADQEFRSSIIQQVFVGKKSCISCGETCLYPQVLQHTKNNFPQLRLDQFFELHKSFHIWPQEVSQQLLL